MQRKKLWRFGIFKDSIIAAKTRLLRKMRVFSKFYYSYNVTNMFIWAEKLKGYRNQLIMLPTCSYGLKNSEDIEINYLFHCHVLDTFYTSCLRVFKRGY